MPQIRPLSAIRYPRNLDLSRLISPPFDVLNQSQKAALQAKDPRNIVTIDLPHIPPKAAGPAEVYQQSAATFEQWIKDGTLVRDSKPSFYPYAQTFERAGRTYRRRGFFALVKITPFGHGPVVPHEKTYRGAIEDRLALMRATGLQLSPVFGLYDDRDNTVADLLWKQLLKPDASAEVELGGAGPVRNDLWRMHDPEIENKVIDFLGERNVYIADGHHRYTTALTYKMELEEKNGGPLPPNHPANWAMFCLVGMSDPGLLILPTHRMIGGLKPFDAAAFQQAISPHFEMAEAPYGPEEMPKFADDYLPERNPHTFGLFDGATRKLYMLRLRDLDLMARLEPTQSVAWRELDVAILQRYLLDEVLQPKFAAGPEITKSYTADAAEIAPQVDGKTCQIALLLQPTPLTSLKHLGDHGEVMPQKSTFFYPKLATGLVINSVRP